MFFGLVAIDDHPCCKMQEVVESFFLKSILVTTFGMDLFPDWIQATLKKGSCTLAQDFSKVHALLHAEGATAEYRQTIYEQFHWTNCIEDICNGARAIPANVIDWEKPLGKAISALMSSLYNSLDLVVFRRESQAAKPTHELYSEFIKKNKYVCPFCGLDKFKNRNGAQREDFDHYLNKSDYPFTAANMKNLVPACGLCNRDYKAAKNILADGSAFYPYAAIPKVKLEVDCHAYPAPDNLSDSGKWSVSLELITPDTAVVPKMKAWDRVYAIKKRLEISIQEFFEEWMKQVSDDHPEVVDEHQYLALIRSAKEKANQRSQRRMEPGLIVKAAFYEFMLSKADSTFVESFRRLRNRSCA